MESNLRDMRFETPFTCSFRILEPSFANFIPPPLGLGSLSRRIWANHIGKNERVLFCIQKLNNKHSKFLRSRCVHILTESFEVWNGQSWPFSTSFYLNTLAIMARNNVSSVVTPEFFYDQLYTYAKTNALSGLPFTGECHYPTVDAWSAYDTNHSENYFHSTYADNIFTNLLGIIPTLDDRLELQPLVPSNWTKFAAENIPYHGKCDCSLMSFYITNHRNLC